jgi:hypothetical protein
LFSTSKREPKCEAKPLPAGPAVTIQVNIPWIPPQKRREYEAIEVGEYVSEAEYQRGHRRRRGRPSRRRTLQVRLLLGHRSMVLFEECRPRLNITGMLLASSGRFGQEGTSRKFPASIFTLLARWGSSFLRPQGPRATLLHPLAPFTSNLSTFQPSHLPYRYLTHKSCAILPSSPITLAPTRFHILASPSPIGKRHSLEPVSKSTENAHSSLPRQAHRAQHGMSDIAHNITHL